MNNVASFLHLPQLLAWIRAHRIASLSVSAFGVVLIAIGVGFLAFSHQPTTVATTPAKPVKKAAPAPPPPPPIYYSPLTGLQVPSEASVKQATTGIMIENSPDARPQSGLKASGVVFEAIAEGGITRFLALYQQEKPQLIGPVRSVRMYYVDWLTPFDASVAHVGGSLFALQLVRNGKYRDIDQFFNSGSYWRSKDRYAPHNVYTSFARLDALNAKKGYVASNTVGFLRKDATPAKPPTATKITVKISGPLYNSTYTYDPPSNTYHRSQAGAPHLDREHGQITPTTVVAMNVNMTLVKEDGWREQITTIGSGKATIFQDGTATEVTWNKPTRGDQLTFTDSAGKPFALNRGQTWIVAVPNRSGSVSWQ